MPTGLAVGSAPEENGLGLEAVPRFRRDVEVPLCADLVVGDARAKEELTIGQVVRAAAPGVWRDATGMGSLAVSQPRALPVVTSDASLSLMLRSTSTHASSRCATDSACCGYFLAR